MPVMTLMNPVNLEIGSQTTWHSSLAATHELAAIVAGHSPAPVRGGLPPRALQRVRQYVDAHLNEKISVQSLANSGLVFVSFRARVKAVRRTDPSTTISHNVEYGMRKNSLPIQTCRCRRSRWRLGFRIRAILRVVFGIISALRRAVIA